MDNNHKFLIPDPFLTTLRLISEKLQSTTGSKLIFKPSEIEDKQLDETLFYSSLILLEDSLGFFSIISPADDTKDKGKKTTETTYIILVKSKKQLREYLNTKLATSNALKEAAYLTMKIGTETIPSKKFSQLKYKRKMAVKKLNALTTTKKRKAAHLIFNPDSSRLEYGHKTMSVKSKELRGGKSIHLNLCRLMFKFPAIFKIKDSATKQMRYANLNDCTSPDEKSYKLGDYIETSLLFEVIIQREDADFLAPGNNKYNILKDAVKHLNKRAEVELGIKIFQYDGHRIRVKLPTK